MKKWIILSMFGIVGCSYLSKKSSDPFSQKISFTYDISIKADADYQNEAVKKICESSISSFISLLADEDYSGRLNNDLVERCLLYLEGIKIKDRIIKNGVYKARYKFDFDIKQFINDIKAYGFLKSPSSRVVVYLDDEIYKMARPYKTDGINIVYKKTGEYEIKGYDYFVKASVNTSKINSSASDVFLSTMNVVINTKNGQEVLGFTASGVSGISLKDSYEKLISDLQNKLVNNKNTFEIKYIDLKIYNIKKLSYVNSLVNFLKSQDLNFYLFDINDKYMIVKVSKNGKQFIHQFVSDMIRHIPDISVINMDEENNLIELEFVNSRLNIAI
ncbi:MAG: hypothetical protein K6357_08010 [Elusimicrobiota bacterium]